MNTRDAMQQLEQLGFTFSLTGDGLTYEFTGGTRPDPAAVRDSLQLVTAERDAAVMLFCERLDTITLALSPEIGRMYSWGATVYRLASLIEAPAGVVGTFEEVPAGRVFMVNIEPCQDQAPAVDQAPVLAWLAAYETWEQDSDAGNDAAHVQRLADLAIAGGLPCYSDGVSDAGRAGWQRLAAMYNPAPAGGAAGHYNNTPQEKELLTQQTKAANNHDRPLPWATSD